MKRNKFSDKARFNYNKGVKQFILIFNLSIKLFIFLLVSFIIRESIYTDSVKFLINCFLAFYIQISLSNTLKEYRETIKRLLK